MRIAMITPSYFPAVRGNAVTVRRLERNLGKAGCEARIYSLDMMGAEDIVARISGNPPDLVHGFHGFWGGRVARLAAQAAGLPYIVTLTGTDVYEDFTGCREDLIHNVLRESTAIVTFHKCIKKRVVERFPTMADKTTVIPQGVELPGSECKNLPSESLPAGVFTFFLPAGLRPVKDVLFPLVPLARLHEREPSIRFILAGPPLDTRYAVEVLERLDRYPYTRYLGEIDHDAIGCLFKKADVVLNTSIFEGGMANSVLEAMAFGKPVLARNIEGNRSLIEDGVTGVLYGDEEEFREKAEVLMKDATLREHLGAAGRKLVLENFSVEKEAEAYLRLYEEVKGER